MVPDLAVHSSDSLEEQMEAVERTAADTRLAEVQRHKVAGVAVGRTTAEAYHTKVDTGLVVDIDLVVDIRKVAGTVDMVASNRRPWNHRAVHRILAAVGVNRKPWDHLLAEHQHLGNPVAHNLVVEHLLDAEEPVEQE